MNLSNDNPLARLPSIDELLVHCLNEQSLAPYGKTAITEALRQSTALFRQQLVEGSSELRITRETASDQIIQHARSILQEQFATSLQAVVNLTGTVLHTNLGRAPMPQSALDAIAEVARGASNLEFDLRAGKRGDRDEHVETWICRLTGAEAATVVNNNAAAVLLVLNTLAQRKEVLVSRGELIEIGGSFRIPDVMKRAGAKLREVGTTNRTHAQDFTDAISEKSALIMKVHTSNYRIEGFTAEVAESELARIAHDNELVFVNDLGSGTLVDLTQFGLPHEPTVSETLAAGADLVTFSGDKLLGGPQAGIIAGKASLVKRIKKNPMKRALRVDKMTLAALEAVLKIYGQPETLTNHLPTLNLLTRAKNEIASLAAQLLQPIAEFVGDNYRVEVIDCNSQIGSGAQPVELIASAGLAISPVTKRGRGRSVENLNAKFRALKPPVIGRIEDGKLIFDLRCLENVDDLVTTLPAARGEQ